MTDTPITDAELERLWEESINDRAILVGSDLRMLISAVRHLQSENAEWEQAAREVYEPALTENERLQTEVRRLREELSDVRNYCVGERDSLAASVREWQRDCDSFQDRAEGAEGLVAELQVRVQELEAALNSALGLLESAVLFKLFDGPQESLSVFIAEARAALGEQK